MGFDGGKLGIQATDKDGNKLGLDASIAGKRRKPVEKPAVGSGSNNDGGRDDNYSAADQMRDIQAQNKKDFTPEAGKKAAMTGWDE